MWGHRANFCKKSAGKSYEKPNKAMDLQESEDEEPSCALAILGTAKPENNMFCIVDGEK